MENTKQTKEILLEFMDFCNKDESLFKGNVYCVQEFIKSSKILALGKQKPLAKNILSIIRKTAIENLENSKHLKNEIPVNKDEHNENKFELLFGENEVLVEEKNIILMRFFNQFTTNDQILNKIKY